MSSRPHFACNGRSRAALLVAHLAVLATSGCKINVGVGYYEDNKRAAVVAMEKLNQRLGAGDYEAIYEEMGGALRAKPKAEVLENMKQTHERWGKFVKAEVKASNCHLFEVRFLVQAQFERGETGEMVVWEVRDNKTRLQHFQIFPGPVSVPEDTASNECRTRKL